MSSDEEAAIIGRMVIERKALQQRGAAISEELGRIADGLKSLGDSLGMNSSYYPRDEKGFFALTKTQAELLDADKISQLLRELKETGVRHKKISDIFEASRILTERNARINSMPTVQKSKFKLRHYARAPTVRLTPQICYPCLSRLKAVSIVPVILFQLGFSNAGPLCKRY